MTFAWQTHAGDRAGTRISFTPPTAEDVPFSIEVVLPVADHLEIDLGGEVFASRLPLFYWKVDAGEPQALQRGVNNFNLPKGTTVLEVGVYRNTQRQILENEYVYKSDSGEPILKTVIFKLRVPPGNVNLPRFGDRDYEIDITRLHTRKPTVIESIVQSHFVSNAAQTTKEFTIKFNQPTTTPLFLSILDATNQAIGADSLTHLDTVDTPENMVKIGILNDPADQLPAPGLLGPAYAASTASVSSVQTIDTWVAAASVPYPIAGNQFGKKSFVIPAGSWGAKFTYKYDRVYINQFIQNSSLPVGWERVFLHLTKKWESSSESGKHYRDSSTEIMDVLYYVL